jgi:hypothetical protein
VPPQRPPLLIGAAVVQSIQAAGVLCASVIVGIDTAAGKSYHLDSGVALTLIGIATAAALGYIAFGLARVRSWSRTPALLTQLFTGIISLYLIDGHRYEWAVPGLVLAVAGFVTILAPRSIRALAGLPPGGPASRVS